MAKDTIHDAVKNALIKDNWNIIGDPYTITYKGSHVYADLGAEKQENNEAKQVIIVEVKSFHNNSPVYDFHIALGQYIGYRDLLSELGKPYLVYLAISQKTYEDAFSHPIIQVIANKEEMLLLIIDDETEEIKQWTQMKNTLES